MSKRRPVLTAYIDTTLVGMIAQRQNNLDELTRAVRLLQLGELGLVRLVTSVHLREELDAVPKQHRHRHEAVSRLFQQLETVPEALKGARADRQDPTLTALLRLLPHDTDARHVFQAAANGCDFFVTVDKWSILRLSIAIEEAAGIKAVVPFHVISAVYDRTRAAEWPFPGWPRVLRDVPGSDRMPTPTYVDTPTEGTLARYGLTVADYRGLVELQQGRCPICERELGWFRGLLKVDYDRANRRARGLLCGDCIVAVRRLDDDPFAVSRAAAYLRRRGWWGTASARKFDRYLDERAGPRRRDADDYG